MFFSKVGRIIAWGAVILGVIQLSMGFIVGFMLAGSEHPAAVVAATRRYLGGTPSGQTINEAIFFIVIGVSIGILTEISRAISLSKK
ncbi:hypothetical protein QCN27_11600 [Cereibacter sp. SYSU M97828]|nr:hypothetical protein [Cereibacter flavus]